MSSLLRIFALFFLTIAFISQWYFVAIIIFLWYLFRYTGYELVVLATVLDAYYGQLNHLPLVTLVVFSAWSIMMMLKPRLLLYTQNNEVVS